MSSVFKPKLFFILKNGISKKQITQDTLSGVVVGIVALPLAIAFAVASGVSPEKGLITAVVAGFIVSLLGGSRVQIAGPTGAFIVIVYGIIEQYGLDGLIISTIMAGVLLIIFGLLRLGTLLKFFPYSLVVGFTSGIALVIFSTQIKDAIGLPIDKVPSAFHEKWMVYFNNIQHVNWIAISITITTILISVYSKKIVKKIPGSFIAIIIMTLLVNILNLNVSTIETFFGNIPNTFEFSIPNFEFSQLQYYIPPAITIALLGAIESLLSAVVADGMIGAKHRSNTELVAQGIANIITPFFGGIPATGAIARTATNIKNGGKTPIAGIIHAITLLLIMLFLGEWAKLIPMSCLAGILIVVSYNMSEWRSFVSILTGSYFDVLILLSTFLITVFYDLTLAIEVGILLSAVLFMKRMADISEKRPNKEVDSDLLEDYSQLPKGIKTYEISGPFFFASARKYSESIQNIGIDGSVLIIRMRHVSFIDKTGIQNLEEALKILKDKEIKIILSGVNKDVMKELNKSNLKKDIPNILIFNNFKDATQKAKNLITQLENNQ